MNLKVNMSKVTLELMDVDGEMEIDVNFHGDWDEESHSHMTASCMLSLIETLSGGIENAPTIQ
jgi:hypothetical protein